MKAQVLVFNVEDEKQINSIKMVLATIKTQAKFVNKSEYKYTLGEIAGIGEKIEETSDQSEVAVENDFHEAMLIFANVDNNTLDTILKAFRKHNIGKFPYKAVLTPTNKDWKPVECFKEISEEHEAMKNYGKPIH